MESSIKLCKHKLRAGGVLALLLLWAAVPLAQADGPRHLDWGREAGRSEWRLDGHNRIYLRTDRGWQRVQGSAIDIADGWVIGTDRRNGGYGIYRWNGHRFERMPGGAVRVGGSYEHPWVINNRGERFEWTGRDWREVWEASSRRQQDIRDHRHDRRRPSW